MAPCIVRMSVLLVILKLLTSHGGKDGEGTDGGDHKEGEEEVGAAHGNGEGGDDEVVAHFDNAELLLQQADEKADQQTCHHAHGGNHHPFDAEDAAYLALLHAHAAEGGNVFAFVQNQQGE